MNIENKYWAEQPPEPDDEAEERDALAYAKAYKESELAEEDEGSPS